MGPFVWLELAIWILQHAGTELYPKPRLERAKAPPPIVSDILRIDSLWQFENLRKLQLDNNIIEKIEGLEHLVHLVWLGKGPSCVGVQANPRGHGAKVIASQAIFCWPPSISQGTVEVPSVYWEQESHSF